MRGKTHIQIALATTNKLLAVPQLQHLFFNQNQSLEQKLSCACIMGLSAMFGGLLADFDKETSTISKFFPAIAKWIKKRAEKAEKGENSKFNKQFWHRRLFHSIAFFPVICTGIASYSYIKGLAILFYVFSGIAIGWVSHSLSDWVVSSVWLFAPFCNKKFSILHLEGKHDIQDKIDKNLRPVVTFWNLFTISKGLYYTLPV